MRASNEARINAQVSASQQVPFDGLLDVLGGKNEIPRGKALRQEWINTSRDACLERDGQKLLKVLQDVLASAVASTESGSVPTI